MKKPIVMMILSILLLVIVNAQADLVEKTPVVIPPEVQEIKDVAGLAPYLNNPDSQIREAVAMRLGEIGGLEAVKLLLQFFEQEPERLGLEAQRGVKEAAIAALGKIGTEEAKQNLTDILWKYIRYGTTIQYGRHYWYDGQTSNIIYASLEALSNFSDTDVINTLETIAENQSMTDGCFFPQVTMRSLLKIRMKQEGIITTKAQVDYLVNILTGSGTGAGAWAGEGIKTPEALKNGAIEDILIGLRKEALPYLEEKINQLPEDTDCAKALQHVIESIKTIISSRQEQ